MVKVGDKVQIDEVSSVYHGHCGVVVRDDKSGILPFRVSFDGGDWSIYDAENLIVLSTEEETRMKFKVGDKVKVKDSWCGRSGEIGEIVRISVYDYYNHRVKFEDAGQESFKEEELELVKEKGFTKSDLKTGMGVVLRNGDKGHVLIDVCTRDVGAQNILRFVGKDTWDDLATANEDLTWKTSSKFDIMEVYKPDYAYMILTNDVFNQECVFKREVPVTKMTMKEINEHFGKQIEIVE